jgi:type IV pilus assembly protein PilX
MPTHPFKKSKESGIVLVTALILLVIMTLLGISGVKIATQEERMAGYSYDRGLTFQAAEAALRQAEIALEVIKPTPTAAGCVLATSGTYSVRVCSEPNPAATPRWEDSTFTGWQAADTIGTGSLAITPQYFAEFLGATNPCGFNPADLPTCKRYRITARAGSSGRAAATVQAIYATD